MPSTVISSPDAPKAVGPYSQGIQVPVGPASKMTFLSGQIPLDPATGELVPGDITPQIERVMKNLKALLTAGGLDFTHVVKCTVYLIDLADFARMNEVYTKYIGSNPPPARVTIQVAALPRGARVEVDAIAVS
jgi:2-iminobutanoate/2-iminopropanoate deaminase